MKRARATARSSTPASIIRRAPPRLACASPARRCSTTSARREACRIAAAASSSWPRTRARSGVSTRSSRQAAACGVDDLVALASTERARLEPDLTCAAALLSPSTGIVDSHAYMQALLGEAEAHGALLVCNTEVAAVRPSASGWSIWIAGEAEPVADRADDRQQRRARGERCWRRGSRAFRAGTGRSRASPRDAISAMAAERASVISSIRFPSPAVSARI